MPTASRFTRIVIACLGVLLVLFLFYAAQAAARSASQVLEDSIVKVYVTQESVSSSSPWNSDNISIGGSGFVIEGKRILTNAHVVADAIFMEIQQNGNPKRYQAEVVAVSHELDIAILTVKDKTFFDKVKALPLGDLPSIHQDIMVSGYPVGGDSLSTTRGIVSRIEYLTYSHSALPYQMIQVDAAINAGNSGGPALADGKVVGIATQTSTEGESIGYIIPVTLIKRFLQDMADGKYDGFPALSVRTEYLLSPTLKKKYKLPEDQTGVLLYRVCANTKAEEALKVNDVITHIDGLPIGDDGTAPMASGGTIDFLHYVDLHQVGDTLSLDIVRDGKPLNVKLLLDEMDKTNYIYDQAPRYFIYGGFVFVAKTFEIGCLTRAEYDLSKHKNKKDDVAIAQVLATPDNQGFHDISDTSIEMVNGQRFDTFEEFYRLVKAGDGQFIELEDGGGYRYTIDRLLAESGDKALLEKYRIQQDHSKDVEGFSVVTAQAHQELQDIPEHQTNAGEQRQ
ncbi:MAG: trypsin-like peptidase domain-containing protein [Thiothrix sp.]|uniref:S1C family serine protease n=1 Tax=Thiothrix sp. TaxID=1032 RepID=UPI0026347323|nr:S1C family serine protease [Thiothrix sp.]MDD5391826.1 trypsin-like peptidase domain-containing protein [Thiothrix sp.]